MAVLMSDPTSNRDRQTFVPMNFTVLKWFLYFFKKPDMGFQIYNIYG